MRRFMVLAGVQNWRIPFLSHDADMLHDSARVASVKQVLENSVLITAFNLSMELRENVSYRSGHFMFWLPHSF